MAGRAANTGAGGLILGGDAGCAEEGHVGVPFAVMNVVNKRPFINGCKGALCGGDQQNTLGFRMLSAARDVAQTTARVLYTSV